MPEGVGYSKKGKRASTGKVKVPGKTKVRPKVRAAKPKVVRDKPMSNFGREQSAAAKSKTPGREFGQATAARAKARNAARKKKKA